MEKQQGYQKYSSNLDAIRTIQSNLMSLKSKISCLTKEENLGVERIFKAFDSTAYLMSKKISQSQHSQVKEAWVNVDTSPNQKSRRRSLLKNRSMSIKKKKQQNRSNLIRLQSKRNQQKILKQAEDLYKERRKHQQKVKDSENQSRRKIEQFHLLKKFHIRKQRKNQQELLKLRAQKALQQTMKVQKEKNSLEQKIQTNGSTLKSIDRVLKYIQRMEKKEINEVANEFHIGSPQNLTESKIRNILNFVNERRKNNQKNKENKNFYRAKSFFS